MLYVSPVFLFIGGVKMFLSSFVIGLIAHGFMYLVGPGIVNVCNYLYWQYDFDTLLVGFIGVITFIFTFPLTLYISLKILNWAISNRMLFVKKLFPQSYWSGCDYWGLEDLGVLYITQATFEKTESLYKSLAKEVSQNIKDYPLRSKSILEDTTVQNMQDYLYFNLIKALSIVDIPNEIKREEIAHTVEVKLASQYPYGFGIWKLINKTHVSHKKIDHATKWSPIYEEKIRSNDLSLYIQVYLRHGFVITTISGEGNDNLSWKRDVIHISNTDNLSRISLNSCTGIGLMLGENSNIRALDFDNLNSNISLDIEALLKGEEQKGFFYDFLQEVLGALGLNKEYPWVVISGSHKGIHILFNCDELNDTLSFTSCSFQEPNYDSYNPNHSLFERVELRWKCHLVLPPSLHKSVDGFKKEHNRYIFVKGNLPLQVPSQVSIRNVKFMKIAREFTSYKKKYDLLDFEDLLLYGYDYLIEHQNKVKRYSWIQVDEVQDLNRLQLAIIELVTAPNNPCVVYLGDEQQAIYSFMGAKLSTLSYLKDQCQGNIHHFHGNYRSPKYLLDVFNQYAETNLHVDKYLLPHAEGENAEMQQPQDALLIESCEQREGFSENDFCAYDMALDRALSYSEGRTAILTYSNKDCDKISERLARKNVEHFKISGIDFLWTKEVKLIFSHLNVFTQPENIMSWARILMGIGVCQKMETAHLLLSEANQAYLRGNDLLDDARRNLIKNFIHDYPNEFVIFDTETTGLDVNNDDIVEIAAIHISNGIVVDELDLMLYTEKTIPPILGNIENPLPDEYKKREKLDRKEGLLMFLNWVGDTPVLAHNAKYDYQILDANLQRDCGIDDLSKRWIKVHDSLAITRVVEPNLNSYKLKDLLATFNLQGKNSHLAIDDVKATKSLVDYCYMKANHVFILQNEFYANHREIIAKIKERYGELYRHTESLLSQKIEEGERNLLAAETEYAYLYFKGKEYIGVLDKMKYLIPFLSEDFIPKNADLSLSQLLDKYMIELTTLRESDLCESNSLKDKVKVYISTVHRAKGLEFENVVVFDVRDGFYPFYEWNNILRDSLDPAERERAKQGIQEDARKLYVAISRAKKRLCIQYPESNTGYGKFGWYHHPANVSPFVTCINPMFKIIYSH